MSRNNFRVAVPGLLAILGLLGACATQPPSQAGGKEAMMGATYRVTQINGEPPPPPMGRGNRYEIRLHETGLAASLGCRTIAVQGAIVYGRFRPSAPEQGAVVTGGGPCGIPAAQQWEPKLEQALLAGEARIAVRDDALTLTAPDLTIFAVR